MSWDEVIDGLRRPRGRSRVEVERDKDIPVALDPHRVLSQPGPPANTASVEEEQYTIDKEK